MIYCLRAKVYWWIYIILIAWIFVIYIGWLASPNWVWFENEDGDRVEGSLTEVTKWEADCIKDTYNDYLDDMCKEDDLIARTLNE